MRKTLELGSIEGNTDKILDAWKAFVRCLQLQPDINGKRKSNRLGIKTLQKTRSIINASIAGQLVKSKEDTADFMAGASNFLVGLKNRSVNPSRVEISN